MTDSDFLSLSKGETTRAWREELERSKERSMHTKRLLEQFLRSCKAIPLPPEVYVLFLIAHVAQGGRITHYHDMPLAAVHNFYMPTKSTDVPIPATCGSSTLDLLLVSDWVRLNLNPTSGKKGPGREFNHGSVVGWRMKTDPSDSGIEAFTNQPTMVFNYSDTSEILAAGNALEMVKELELIPEEFLSGFEELDKRAVKIPGDWS